MKIAHACFLAGAHVDVTGRLLAPPVMGSSNPGTVSRAPGGSGLNAASVAAALGLGVSLAGPVGADDDGRLIRRTLGARHIGDALVDLEGHATGQYTAIIAPDGQMTIGLADLAIHEAVDARWFIAQCGAALEKADCWVLSANMAEATLMEMAAKAGNRLVCAASVSPAKAVRLKSALPRIGLLFTNLREARALAGKAEANAAGLAKWLAAAGVKSGILTDAGGPVTFFSPAGIATLAPPRIELIADVNGAGDALAGAVLAGLARGLALEKCTALGIAAAQLTLASAEPFAAGLSWPVLEEKATAIAPALPR